MKASIFVALLFQAQPGLPDMGPKLGERLPAFTLPDQEGRPRDFASLKGPQGLVLVFFRSADW